MHMERQALVYKILFDGEQWWGSNASACVRALRRLGHHVIDVDVTTTIPEWRNIGLKVTRKIILPLLIREYNQNIIKIARGYKPEIFLAYKGAWILPKTLSDMRSLGIAIYNYYPDVSVFSHGSRTIPFALKEYDCVFSTKSFLEMDLAKRGFLLKNFCFLPHGYDTDTDYPINIDKDDQISYGSDVTFIGIHDSKKENILAALKDMIPEVNLVIWGDRWNRSKSRILRGCIRGRAIFGIEYIKALCASRIALALLSEKQVGSSCGDYITSRTFNIPASKTFMIHERTNEVLNFFKEAEEIECFGTVEELSKNIRYYLAHPEKRQAIADAGYRRCVPAYSIDNRIKSILEWHQKNRIK